MLGKRYQLSEHTDREVPTKVTISTKYFWSMFDHALCILTNLEKVLQLKQFLYLIRIFDNHSYRLGTHRLPGLTARRLLRLETRREIDGIKVPSISLYMKPLAY